MIKFYALVSVFLLWAFAGIAIAAQRGGFDVTKTYLNEGNNRTPVGVACSSTTWTEAIPAGITRRAAALHTLSTADETVCLSTATASDSSNCSAATKGYHLEKGGSLIDNSEAILYCKVASGSSAITAYSVYIYGMIYKESKDDGDLTN